MGANASIQLEAGLLDELKLMISLVVAGGGRTRLFPDDAAPAQFELAEATPLRNALRRQRGAHFGARRLLEDSTRMSTFE